MKIYHVAHLPNGWVSVRFSYDAATIERIKACIPSSARCWNAEAKQWEFTCAAFNKSLRAIFPAPEWCAVIDPHGGAKGSKPPPRAHTAPPGRSYHATLYVTPDAPAEVIEASYRALIRKHHPDNGGSEEMAKQINGAYHALKTK